MNRSRNIPLYREKAKSMIMQPVDHMRNASEVVVNRLTILIDWLLIFKNGGKLQTRRLSLVKPVPQVGGRAQLLLDLENCYAVEVNGTRLSGRTKKMHLAISEGKNEINIVCYGKDELLKKTFIFTGLHFQVDVPNSPFAITIPSVSMNKRTVANPLANLKTVISVNEKVTSIESLHTETEISLPAITLPIIPTFKQENFL